MRYPIPEKFTETEIVVVNSRFIASATPVFSNEEARDFINNIKGLQMGKEERKEFLRSMPVIQEWWKKLFPMIEFLDKKIERG